MALLDRRSLAGTVHPKNANANPRKIGAALDKSGLIRAICRKVRKGPRAEV